MRCNRQGSALTAMAAAAGVLAVACGSGTSASSASSSPAVSPATSASASTPLTALAQVATKATSSCDVINQAEAGAALGQPVQPAAELRTYYRLARPAAKTGRLRR